MKIYHSYFASNLSGIDEICQWVSETIQKHIHSARFSYAIAKNTESRADSHIAYFSLFLFEILSNIIEHRALGLKKSQVYENQLRYIQYIYQRYPIYAYLSFSALRFWLCLSFSHILCHCKKAPSRHRIYGGKGIVILKYLFADAKYQEIYQNQQCIFLLRGRLDSVNLL